MKKPRALDLFCCAGGASMGLHRAGFDVTGVDIKKQPRYPFRFIQANALQPPVRLEDFDFIWASPPCQAHTALKKMWNAKSHPDLIPETRELLIASGVPYAIENVPGAPLKSTIRLCGTMFNLQTPCGAELRRHRYFETSFMMLAPPCSHGRNVVGVYGGHVRDRCRTITVTGNTPQQNVERNRVRKTFSVEDAAAAMGIDWMTMAGLSQAIPPAYAEYIGRAALAHINFLSASTPRGESGGFTTAPGSHRVVEAAAVIPSSVSSRVADVASGARSDPPPPIVGAASNPDIAIPGFLRRDPDNLAEWMRKS